MDSHSLKNKGSIKLKERTNFIGELIREHSFSNFTHKKPVLEIISIVSLNKTKSASIEHTSTNNFLNKRDRSNSQQVEL